MPSYNERRDIIKLSLCNLILGPIIFILGIVTEVQDYVEKRDTKNANENDLTLKYYPLFWAHGSLIFCSFVSGLCANFAVTVFCKSNWEIKFLKVATFLAKALFCQILLYFFYNVDPIGWRTHNGLLGPRGPIELPVCTCFYCFVVQYYYATECTKFVKEAQKLAKVRQGIERRVQQNRR
ncbi:uncharacterized protein LOC110850098 [Folsomia candida]|nr:uncharacterized protein LOC110850098 [Folsomia candida]